MSAAPDHLLTQGRLLTLDEFDRLPEDSAVRYELREGVLHISRRAASLQRRVVANLTSTLNDQLPDGWRALSDVEVVLVEQWPATVCHADAVVTSATAEDPQLKRLHAHDVLVVTEFLSPGSARMSHRAEYAKVGIPAYWVLEIRDRITLAESRLIRGEYETYFQDRGMFYTGHPFELMVDIDSLPRRRTRP